MQYSFNDRTEEPIRRLHHMHHISGISRKIHVGYVYYMRFIVEMNVSNLSRSLAWVNPYHAGAAYSSFATVIALAPKCRALGDKP